jgi:hypothetical protein
LQNMVVTEIMIYDAHLSFKLVPRASSVDADADAVRSCIGKLSMNTKSNKRQIHSSEQVSFQRCVACHTHILKVDFHYGIDKLT